MKKIFDEVSMMIVNFFTFLAMMAFMFGIVYVMTKIIEWHLYWGLLIVFIGFSMIFVVLTFYFAKRVKNEKKNNNQHLSAYFVDSPLLFSRRQNCIGYPLRIIFCLRNF
jgi:Ca2+/Na+ antiporter